MRSRAVTQDASPPQISMPNQPKGHNPYADDDDEQENAKKHSPNKAKQQQPAQQKQEKTQSAGWFGGIWSKLAPKPKNQMKLPDDKNPTVRTKKSINSKLKLFPDVHTQHNFFLT